MEIPSTPWREAAWRPADAYAHAPCPAAWHPLEGSVGHTFTHFHLELSIAVGRVSDDAVPDDLPEGIWVRPDRLGEHALPTLMKKLVRHVLAGLKAAP
jgi:A/G-specific adenine glycosylase